MRLYSQLDGVMPDAGSLRVLLHGRQTSARVKVSSQCYWYVYVLLLHVMCLCRWRAGGGLGKEDTPGAPSKSTSCMGMAPHSSSPWVCSWPHVEATAARSTASSAASSA